MEIVQNTVMAREITTPATIAGTGAKSARGAPSHQVISNPVVTDTSPMAIMAGRSRRSVRCRSPRIPRWMPSRRMA
jgi:hypothetical protein